jgi:lipoprotein-anchoring transpeptidase ErfK/SrfK
MNPRYLKQEVRYEGRETPGTVIINTTERHLYLVTADGRAVRYGIGVGRPGSPGPARTTSRRSASGRIDPPPEMLKRRPDLPRHMAGGPDNRSARAPCISALALSHPRLERALTIGQAVSSGCIRMRNEDVIDLYEKIKVGTKVVVI